MFPHLRFLTGLILFISAPFAPALQGEPVRLEPVTRPDPRLGSAPVFPDKVQDSLNFNRMSAPETASLDALAVEDVEFLDTSDRETVRIFFNAVYSASEGVPSGWTGSVGFDGAAFSGDPGTTTGIFRNAVQLRVNFYRVLAGLEAGITFLDSYNSGSQEAALMMSSANDTSADPGMDWPNYTPDGAEAAAASNLSLGTNGADAVDLQMQGNGADQAGVAHRRWLLYPQTREMGTGDVDASIEDFFEFQAANALWVMDSRVTDPRPPTREEFVAWPPPGFAPYPIVPPRWSLALDGADFSNASVTITEDGNPVPVSLEPVVTGEGENTLVFRPFDLDAANPDPDQRDTWERPDADREFLVSISGIEGAAQPEITYSVTLFDPESPPDGLVSTDVSGEESVNIGAPESYSFPSDPRATGYVAGAGRATIFSTPFGAEGDGDSLSVFSSGGYETVSTLRAHLGNASYHLVHTDFSDESITFETLLLPSPTSELQFMEHIGPSGTGEVREIQVSTSNGLAWTAVYSQRGDGDASLDPPPGPPMQEISIPLGDYAEIPIRIRLNYRSTPGTHFLYAGDDADFASELGWYVDDLWVTNARMIQEPVLVSLGRARSFDFDPPEPGSWALFARPQYFDSFAGPWGSALILSATGNGSGTGISSNAVIPETSADVFFPTAREYEFPGWRLHPEIGPVFVPEFPWIYHFRLGWVFVYGESDQGGFFLFIPGLGWVWTQSPGAFPYLYDMQTGGWIYLDLKISRPDTRWFYRYDPEGWFSPDVQAEADS